MNEVLEMLTANGWVPDGRTVQQTVRIPTTKSPVFGGIGGELATFGGRQRLHLPETNYKVTVGKQTTYFYQSLGNGEVKPIAHLQTRELDRIRQTMQQVQPMQPTTALTETQARALDEQLADYKEKVGSFLQSKAELEQAIVNLVQETKLIADDWESVVSRASDPSVKMQSAKILIEQFRELNTGLEAFLSSVEPIEHYEPGFNSFSDFNQ